MVATVSGVVVDKPWYLSKKIWLCVLALVFAIVQAVWPKALGVDQAHIVHYIVVAATFLLPLLGTILAFAHVDATTKAAALIADALKTAASLEEGDAAPPP